MRVALLTMVLAVAAVAVPVSAQAVTQSYHLNIPRQPLDGALKDLAQQTGLQIARFSDTPGGSALVGPVSGEMTVGEALTSLLVKSGLTYKMVNDRTIAVVAPGPEPGASAHSSATGQASPATSDDGKAKEGKKSSSGPFRVAQADQGKAASEGSVDQKDEQASKTKRVVLEEVIVTGSRIPSVAGQHVVPVRSYTRQDIEESGQTTLIDFLNNLPDVSVSHGEDYNDALPPGQTTVRLHGLPIGTTLMLLNGRRVPISYMGFFDLSSISVSAIERIEVLPVGASAIYGADALGGAVNLILRKNFSGFEADGKFAHAAGVSDTDANLDWGRSWERGSISFLGTYQDRAELMGSQREPTSTINFPAGAPTFFYLSDDCAPGNVYSLSGQNLPGLSSPQAGIPVGISGTPTTQQFAATAGKLNRCNSNSLRTLLPRAQREGALASAHYQIAESVDLFTEIMFSNEHLQASYSSLIGASHATLGGNNPYNPFGTAVGVSFTHPDLPQIRDVSEGSIQPLIGARGSLFSDWHYEASTYLSHTRIQSGNLNVDGNALNAALNSSDPAAALNPFTTGAPGTPQLLQTLVTSAAPDYTLLVSQLFEAQGILRGPLVHLPGGPLEVALGSEYGDEKQAATLSYLPMPQDLRRHSYAAFTEARVPLLADPQNPQVRDRLTLTLAGRYDHTNDYGGKTTWQSGLLWRASESFSLSGSYGVSYKAPRLPEISGGQLSFPGFLQLFGLIDPLRGGELVHGTIVEGSNPNLKPETGDSRTLSVEYSSQTLHGLKASLNYFAVNISNYISIPDPQNEITYSNLYSGLVMRGPATPQDQQQGRPGPITQINDIYFNFGDLHVAGFNADVSYGIDTGLGQFTPSLAVANIYKWQSALTPDSPSIGYVSQAGGSPGWAPRWKGTAALNWKRGPVSANLAGRYIGRYKDYPYVPNTNELGNFWIFDLNTRFELGPALAGKPWLAGTYVALGAVNLLDKAPQFSYGTLPFDASENNIRGRLLYAQVGAKW